MPGSANLDDVEVAGQPGREGLIGGVALHDFPYRVVDGRHAAGKNEGHRLHRAVATDGDRHQRLGVRLLHQFTYGIESRVEVDLSAPGFCIQDEFGVGVGAPEEAAATQ